MLLPRSVANALAHMSNENPKTRDKNIVSDFKVLKRYEDSPTIDMEDKVDVSIIIKDKATLLLAINIIMARIVENTCNYEKPVSESKLITSISEFKEAALEIAQTSFMKTEDGYVLFY